MSCPLIGLATELQHAIIQQLDRTGDQASLRSWSCTCAFYRSLLAPYLYKRIVLRNYEKSASSVHALANSQFKGCIDEINYTAEGECTDVDNWQYWTGETRGDFGNPEAVTDPEEVFPDTVHTLLSDLQRFPRLKTLSIEFPVNFKRKNWGFAFYSEMFDEEETEDEIQSAEENEGWRALMAKTFTALSLNDKPSIKTLEIKKLYPFEISTFRSETFHDFLGPLDRFDLSLFGGENGAGWCINCSNGYLEFVSKLDTYFFDHLNNVTEFCLRAEETGPLGLSGRHHATLALRADQMPLLKSVSLENIFVSPELVDFLVGHTKTLERISLKDCFGGINGETENGIHWEALFTALSDAKPEKLRQFDVLPLDPPYQNMYSHADLSETDGVHLCRTMLEQDPKRRLFPYKILDDKYGTLFHDEDQTLESFLEGDDQKAYDRLICIIDDNASKLASGHG
ncbi:hypothetical protein MMC30_004695 [Trapelia coarctata]|nr:hypothetical protein [Trapelia coarctata]